MKSGAPSWGLTAAYSYTYSGTKTSGTTGRSGSDDQQDRGSVIRLKTGLLLEEKTDLTALRSSQDGGLQSFRIF